MKEAEPRIDIPPLARSPWDVAEALGWPVTILLHPDDFRLLQVWFRGTETGRDADGAFADAGQTRFRPKAPPDLVDLSEQVIWRTPPPPRDPPEEPDPEPVREP